MFGQKEIDMTTGKLLPKMIRFAIPILLTTILQLLFNAADMVVVSKYGSGNAFAAVGATSALINLIINLFIGLSVGANIIVAKAYGEGNHQTIQRAVHTSILSSLIGGVVLAVIGITLARPLLVLMGCPPTVLDLSVLYMRIYFMGMPAVLFFNFSSSILKAAGDSQSPLIYLTIAGAINVVLNLFFVIVLHMTVDGVAIATIASQTISSILVIRYLRKTDKPIHLEWNKLRIDFSMLGEMLRVGIPAGIQASLISLSNVVIQSAINSFGEIIVQAHSAAGSIDGFIYASFNACQQACINFTSQNRGAKKFDRTTKCLWISVAMVTIAGVILCELAVLLGRPLLGIYSNDPEVIKWGLVRMHNMTVLYFLYGIGDVMGGYLRGMGYSFIPTIIALICACGMRVVWVYTIFPIFGTLQGLYYSYPVTWVMLVVSMFTCICLTCSKYWGKRNEVCEAMN